MSGFLQVTFPASGVTTSLLLPPLTAFAVSFFASMGGLSGAFLLLPFQMSVLGYTAPSVSATNQLFNIVAIPSGVWRYARERRMVWPLTGAVVIGTLPGVVLGAWLRLEYLPDPKTFKIFAGMVLLFVGGRLLADLFRRKQAAAPNTADFAVADSRFSLQQAEFSFAGRWHSFSVPKMFLLCLLVGIIGGIYGRCPSSFPALPLAPGKTSGERFQKPRSMPQDEHARCRPTPSLDVFSDIEHGRGARSSMVFQFHRSMFFPATDDAAARENC